MTKEERLSKIGEVTAKIYEVDASFPSYEVQEKLREFFNDLSEQFAEYAEENRDFSYSKMSILLDDAQVTISKLTHNFTDRADLNKEIFRENVDSLKRSVKRWTTSLE